MRINNFKYSLSPLAIASFAMLVLIPQAQAQSSRQCFTFTSNAGQQTACLDKTASPNPATVGQPLTFTITESTNNLGGSAAQNAAATVADTTPLIDTLPPGLIFVSATNNGGANAPTGFPAAPPCTFTPAADPSTSSGTVTCPGPRAFTGAGVLGPQPVPFITTITVIATQAGAFSNPVRDGFNAISAPYTVLNAELRINYFAGADGSRPDATVRITNPGSGIDPAINPTGDLCANIYVFRADQQLAECCSCPVTPNGLRTLSVDFDLTHNPLTSPAIGEGVIKIVSSTGTSCTAATAASTFVPSAALRAWAVHNQDVSSPGNLAGVGVINQVTETEFSGAPLSAEELKNLQKNCGFILSQGSGAGRCSCGRGD